MSTMRGTTPTKVWRTKFEPVPDITAYELALDMKFVNASQVLGSWDCEAMGSALRHRTLDDFHHTMNGQRMDAVYEAFAGTLALFATSGKDAT